MIKKIGIRREDKNKWEKRVPLVPTDVKQILEANPGISIFVQPSEIRVFRDIEYSNAGCTISENLDECDLILGVKEIPLYFFRPGKTYLFFSHTIKGQTHNMPMLKKILELGCTLMDYEKIVDEKGKRLVFFGVFAGLAGMIDSLWALGKRYSEEGFRTPFSHVKLAHEYSSLEEAKNEIREIGAEIRTNGLPQELSPIVFGFAGYGNVSKGAQEIFDLLPFREFSPAALLEGKAKELDSRTIGKVVFREEDTVIPRDPSKKFDLQDYFQNPESYLSNFRPYANHLSVLMNCIYWSPKSPRLLTKVDAEEIWGTGRGSRLKVIGDISCDIGGGIEFTIKETTPDNPVYVYDPITGKMNLGVKGNGPVVMAVDNLPCELPREASSAFSKALLPLIPYFLKIDSGKDFDSCGLPDLLKRATLAWKGKLTPDFEYLYQHLKHV